MTARRIRIRTPSRLHFGLLGWGPRASRQFGGVGLMVEEPGIDLVLGPAEAWRFEGPHADRARQLVERIEAQLLSDFARRPFGPARIRVVSAPPEHIGLGVGTQLSLSVARALFEMSGMPDPSPDDLVRLSGRGRRSGIGLHGFLQGGLIVDGGRRDEAGVPPLLARVPFPDWSVLIVRPPEPPGRSGDDEIRAFTELPPPSKRVTDRLCRLILLGILPAALERDLDTFGSAVGEFQREVGTIFAPMQGGTFASPLSASLIAELTRLGLVGAGQSSWGPTVYAFCDWPQSERHSISVRLQDRFGLRPDELLWTRAANHGVVIHTVP